MQRKREQFHAYFLQCTDSHVSGKRSVKRADFMSAVKSRPTYAYVTENLHSFLFAFEG
jgi:hypothetical protein